MDCDIYSFVVGRKVESEYSEYIRDTLRENLSELFCEKIYQRYFTRKSIRAILRENMSEMFDMKNCYGVLRDLQSGNTLSSFDPTVWVFRGFIEVPIDERSFRSFIEVPTDERSFRSFNEVSQVERSFNKVSQDERSFNVKVQFNLCGKDV